ncbi:MAG: Flp family type IVb pilin [Bacillota bacterium]
MFEKFKSLHRDQRGQGMAEYGLIIALVAVAAIIAFSTLGGGISSKIDKVNDALK